MGSDPDALLAKERLRTQLFEESPRSIGRYVIDSELGSGAMGKVYRARDPKLERDVAIKVLIGGMVSPEMSDRFLREAQALARLTHPNVVQVFEVGLDGTERFIAMELVEGGTLSTWLAERDRSIDEIVDVFVELAGGLQAAHNAGILHRDFKPTNVLVGTDGRPRITDFGLAGAERTADTPEPPRGTPSVDRLSGTLTREGHVVGTPAYMSPEQFAAQTLDGRSDQFSFCVTLFESLYGERPYRARSVAELARIVSEGALRRPEGVDVPPRLDAVVVRGLSADRNERYRSMDALAKALRRAQRRSAPGLAGFAAVAGVSAVALTAIAVWPEPPCEPTRVLVDETWGRSQRAAVEDGLQRAGIAAPRERAAWVNARLGDFLDAWTSVREETCRGIEDNPDAEGRDTAFACLRRQREAVRSAVELLSTGEEDEVKGGLYSVARLDDPAECGREGTLAPPPELEGRVAALQAELERTASIALVRRSDPVRRRAEEIVRKAEALGYAPLLAEALLLHATLVVETSSELKSEGPLQRAFALATEAGDGRLEVRAATALAESLGADARRFEEAERWLRTARSLGERAPQETWRVDLAEARVRRVQHRFDEAVVLDRSGLEKAAAVLGEGHIYVARARINLAMDLATNQQTEEAERQLDRVLGELEPAFGRDHPVLAGAYYAQAQLRRSAGDLEGAVDAMRASVDAFGGVRGELTLRRADRLQALAAITAQSGRYEEACEYFERVLDYYEDALDSDDPRIGRLLGNLALAYRFLGKHAEARTFAERAVVVAQTRGGEKAPLAAALSLLADVLFASGEYEAAAEQCRRALALDDVPVARRIALQQSLAVSLGALGREQEAITELAAAAKKARELFGRTPNTASLLANEGYYLAKVGRAKEGQSLVREAAEIVAETLGEDHYELSRTLHVQVYVESELGNLDEAETLARRVLTLRKDAGQDPLELAAAHFSLAEVLRKAKKNPEEVLEHAGIARRLYANADASEDLAEVEAFLESQQL